ncbi:MAG: hypothetical protein LBD03_03195 [Methanobrevibacter sp.]|jgi:hypothetical protein|nr:hypothetical protein [Candidatus Methanovirga procula]
MFKRIMSLSLIALLAITCSGAVNASQIHCNWDSSLISHHSCYYMDGANRKYLTDTKGYCLNDDYRTGHGPYSTRDLYADIPSAAVGKDIIYECEWSGQPQNWVATLPNYQGGDIYFGFGYDSQACSDSHCNIKYNGHQSHASTDSGVGTLTWSPTV